MGFLAPWLLAGLATLGLPVYLHLLRQHKTTPRPFSSLMFFERRIQSSVKHRRLKYRVLLALRALFLALLILAFARPVLETSGIASAHAGRILAILIDNSFSMRQGDRHARAQAAALRVSASMQSADQAQVIVFGGGTRLLTNLTNDRSAIEAAIRSVEPGDGAGSYAEVVRAVRSLTQTVKAPVEAHLFSDLQKTNAPSNFSDLLLPEGTQLVPHSAADGLIPNVAVESVNAPKRLFRAKSGSFEATIVSYSDQPATKQVSLLLNGHTLESKNVVVPPHGRAVAAFTAVDAPYGLNHGEVRITGGDAFPEDDHAYFALERSDPAPALFVHVSTDNRSALYFQTALTAVNQPAFTLTSWTYEQASNAALDRFSFVVLSDPSTLARGFEDSLKRYVTHGGSVLVILGHMAGGRVPVADLQLEALNRTSRDGSYASISKADTTHPALRITSRWDGIRFFRVVPVQTGTARVLMRLDDDIPLLLESPLGDGRVLTFASSFDNVDNDFPVHPVFVPFVQRMTDYLGRVETATGSYTAGAFYDLRASASAADPPIEVTGPHGERVLSIAESSKVRSLPLEHEGFYDIRRQNGRHELAAVNPDRRESDFAMLPAETLALWKSSGTPSRTPGAAQGGESVQHRNELWWWVLLIAFALAIAESVLGNQHLEVKEGVG